MSDTCEFAGCLGGVFSWGGGKGGVLLVWSADAWEMFSSEEEGRKELLVSSPDAWRMFSRGKERRKELYL